ncbi:MAG: hypothetical protein RBT61_12835 [Candidatus Kapabacteria bacterium]|nr:hypothetical protein [Candidatus Kapabacteria bacterium]
MKNLLVILFFLTLSYGVSNAQCSCDTASTPWSYDSTSWDVAENCWIWAEYEYRTVNCNGNTYYEFRVIGWVAAISDCPEFLPDYPIPVWEWVSRQILADGIPTFPFVPPGQCITQFRSMGPSCWEQVYRAVGPVGAGYYAYKCADEPVCCRPYKICRSLTNVVTVTDLPYTPVTCTSVIGPESNQPCYTSCP